MSGSTTFFGETTTSIGSFTVHDPDIVFVVEGKKVNGAISHEGKTITITADNAGVVSVQEYNARSLAPAPEPTSTATTTTTTTTPQSTMKFEDVAVTYDGEEFTLSGKIRNMGTVTSTFGVVASIKDGDIAFGYQMHAHLDANPLDAGVATGFHTTYSADGHTKATFTYWGENGKLKTPKYTISYP